MALSDLTSPIAIRLAIQECDRLGREQFLRHYGFAPAQEYLLRYKGKTYDSKAIGFVTHGVENPSLGVLRNVSGGRAHPATPRAARRLSLALPRSTIAASRLGTLAPQALAQGDQLLV